MDSNKVITATFSNDPPTANAGADQMVLAGTLVTLDGSASFDTDPMQTLTYGWTQIAGPVVTLSDSSAVSPSFTPTISGELSFSLVVTDSMGLASMPDSVTITVTNGEPVANAGPDQTVDAGSTVTLDGSASSDPDGHAPLRYVWRQTAGPIVTLIGANTAKPSFITPNSYATLSFELIVSDSIGQARVADRVTIRVKAINVAQYTVYLPTVRK